VPKANRKLTIFAGLSQNSSAILKAFPEGVSSNEISPASEDEAGSLSQFLVAPDLGIAQR
jgi:hypothetical protein